MAGNIYHILFPEDLKKVYLIIYNLFQWIGFMYILTVMAVRYTKLEYASVPDTYEHVGSAMKFLQLLQYLEVMHPLFGYTRVRPLIGCRLINQVPYVKLL